MQDFITCNQGDGNGQFTPYICDIGNPFGMDVSCAYVYVPFHSGTSNKGHEGNTKFVAVFGYKLCVLTTVFKPSSVPEAKRKMLQREWEERPRESGRGYYYQTNTVKIAHLQTVFTEKFFFLVLLQLIEQTQTRSKQQQTKKTTKKNISEMLCR